MLTAFALVKMSQSYELNCLFEWREILGRLNLEYRDLDGGCAKLAQRIAEFACLTDCTRYQYSFAGQGVALHSFTTLRSSLDLIASGSNVPQGLKPRTQSRWQTGTTKVMP
jgi:hypothetical protein